MMSGDAVVEAPQLGHHSRRVLRLCVAAGAAIAVAALAAGAGPLITSTASKPIEIPALRNIGHGFRTQLPPNRARTLNQQRPSSPSDALHIVSVVLTVLALVGLVAVLWFAVRALLRKYWGPLDRDTFDDATVAAMPGAAEAAAQVRTAVSRALDALDDESDPRRAVVECWLRFEAALREQGMTRDAAETATELSGRASASYAVSPDLLQRLNQLFRAARYSSAPVPPEAPAAARAVLEEIRRRLGPVREPVG
jgi:Domain of unknown function (DUF4129)